MMLNSSIKFILIGDTCPFIMIFILTGDTYSFTNSRQALVLKLTVIVISKKLTIRT